jgi:hypothetical protein
VRPLRTRFPTFRKDLLPAQVAEALLARAEGAEISSTTVASMPGMQLYLLRACSILFSDARGTGSAISACCMAKMCSPSPSCHPIWGTWPMTSVAGRLLALPRSSGYIVHKVCRSGSLCDCSRARARQLTGASLTSENSAGDPSLPVRWA